MKVALSNASLRLLIWFLLFACAGLQAQSKNQQRAQSLYQEALKARNANDRLKLLRQALVWDPYAARIEYALGREFYQQSRLDSAVAHFEQVIVLDPALADQAGLRTLLPPAYNALANRHLSEGNLDAGLAAATAALRHNENFAPALATATQASYQLNRYDAAIAFGERLVRAQPTARNYYNLGAAYEAKQALAAAAQQYRQALSLDPSLAAAKQKLEQLEKAASPVEAVPPQPPPTLTPHNKRNHARSQMTPAGASARLPQADFASRRKSESNPQKNVRDRKQPPAVIPEVTYETGVLRLAKPQLEIIRFLDSVDHRNLQRALAEREQKRGDFWLRLLILTLPVGPLWYYLKRRPLSRQVVLADLKHARDGIAVGVRRGAMRMRTALRRRLPAPAPAHALALPGLAAPANLEMVEPHGHSESKDERSSPLPEAIEQRSELTGKKIMDEQAAAGAPATGFGLQTEILFAEMIAASPGQIDAEKAEQEEKPVVASARSLAAHETSDGSTPAVITTEEFTANGATTAAPEPEPVEFLAASSWQHREPADSAQQDTAVSLLNELEAEAPLDIADPYLSFEHDSAVAAAQALLNGAARLPTNAQAAAPAIKGNDNDARATPAPPPPQRISRYVIDREISKGATGRIYKAWDPKLDRAVVLKIVHYGFGASAHEIQVLKDRIYREARAIAKLNHPNIVVVYDIDDEPGFSYIVMEHLEGRDLGQILQNGQRLSSSRALDIVMQVCSALEYAHQAGVFHRDIKPSNIMLLANEEAKVMDFGIAKINDYLTLTQTGRVLGTPSYMAPEQIEGHETDGRADLFSLGVVLYELLAGKRPFLADTLASLAYKIVHTAHQPLRRENSELPPELDEVLERALAKQPAARFQTAAAFRQALLQVRRKLA